MPVLFCVVWNFIMKFTVKQNLMPQDLGHVNAIVHHFVNSIDNFCRKPTNDCTFC